MRLSTYVVLVVATLVVCSDGAGHRKSTGRKRGQKRLRAENGNHDDQQDMPASWMSFFQGDQPLDPCVDERGGPRRCIPDFKNAAHQKRVHGTSTCGRPPSRLCQVTPSGSGAPMVGEELVRTCQVCDAEDSDLSHPASLLTDINNPSRPTCWMSQPFSLNSPEERNVSLKISLGKAYELTYISLQFCGSGKPDSLAIYKSSDFGQTWQPFQFYSTNCQQVYHMSPRSPAGAIPPEREHEPLCSDPNGDSNAQNPTRIAFSTLEGRPSAYQFDNSPLLQDWVTATDIRIDFRRLLDPNQQILSDSPSEPHHSGNGLVLDTDSSMEWANDTGNIGSSSLSEDNSPQQSSYYFYSLADLAIGGRCKCNGHASRCIRRHTDNDHTTMNSTGSKRVDHSEVVCDCRHNTAGKDCEKCAPYYFDRPWARGIAGNANECKRK